MSFLKTQNSTEYPSLSSSHPLSIDHLVKLDRDYSSMIRLVRKVELGGLLLSPSQMYILGLKINNYNYLHKFLMG